MPNMQCLGVSALEDTHGFYKSIRMEAGGLNYLLTPKCRLCSYRGDGRWQHLSEMICPHRTEQGYIPLPVPPMTILGRPI